MREDRDVPAPPPTRDDLTRRVRDAAGELEPLIAEARAAQVVRARAQGAPRWTDVFTTQFTEFSNRPR
jgi:hypothetical protein